jgi:hypothetical protein
MSRPRKTFSEKDIQQMEQLARCHCTDDEIAAFLGVSETTLKRRFGPVLKTAREAGRANLRAKQFQMAIAGNVTLLIWLGKVLLGQREEQPSVTITAHPSPKTDTALNEIKDLLKAKECSSTLTPPLSLVPGQGLLAHS